LTLLFDICQFLNDSAIGTAIRESDLMFPIIESVHVLGIALLVGTVAILDLRLLGLILRREPVSQIAGQILPWTWAGFAVMFASGFLLFWAEALKCYGNPAFRLKVLLLLLVGLNPFIFHSTIYRRVSEWDTASVTPVRARLAAVLSLSLWSGVIVTGRAIAYFKSALR
jgi:hypothetical protein